MTEREAVLSMAASTEARYLWEAMRVVIRNRHVHPFRRKWRTYVRQYQAAMHLQNQALLPKPAGASAGTSRRSS